MRIIEDREEKIHWMNEMIGIKNTSLFSAHRWQGLFTQWLVDLPVMWTHADVVIDLEASKLWVEQNRTWKHRGGRTSAHNNLGMAYAHLATTQMGLSDFVLRDSPDFTARLGEQTVIGDIGQCTPNAVFNGSGYIGMHDLWVSVFSSCQIVLEFNYSLSAFRTLYMRGITEWTESIEHHLGRVFDCKECGHVLDDLKIQSVKKALGL